MKPIEQELRDLDLGSKEEQQEIINSLAVISSEVEPTPAFPSSAYWTNFSLRVREKISGREERQTLRSRFRFWKVVPQYALAAILIVFAVRFNSTSNQVPTPTTPLAQQTPAQAESVTTSFADEIVLDEVADIAVITLESEDPAQELDYTHLGKTIDNLTDEQLDEIIDLEEEVGSM